MKTYPSTMPVIGEKYIQKYTYRAGNFEKRHPGLRSYIFWSENKGCATRLSKA